MGSSDAMDKGQVHFRPEIVGLLERSNELSRLHDCVEAAADRGRGQVVLVCGEAGIGKTALLREFTAALPHRVSVLWGTCDPLFTPRPLGPLFEVAADAGGEVADLLGAGTRAHEVAQALLSALRRAAPSVLVLEDLHWADEATFDVVRLLSRQVVSAASVLVLSFRDDCLHDRHPLRLVLGDLPSGGAVVRLSLTGLSRSAVGAIAEQTSIDADDLYARTAGNPFFVTEAIEAGSEVVPETVRDVVLARIARLSDPARELLDAIAVIPQRTEVWLLEAMVDGGLGALDECLGSGVLRREAHGVVFRHELARLAVEHALSPDRAVALHRRALAALERTEFGEPDLARLAHHAEEAGDGPAVLRYAPAAGEQAASLGSPREAQNQYARALRFAENLSVGDRAPMIERFCDLAYLSDQRLEAADAMHEVILTYRRAGDHVRHGDALRRRALLLSCMGRLPEALDDVRESIRVLELAPPGPELARAYSSAASLSRDTDTDGALVYGERAIELSERLGATEVLAYALGNVGFLRANRGELEGYDLLERSLELGLRDGLETQAGFAYINLVWCLGHAHQWNRALHYVQAGIAYCASHGRETWSRALRGLRGRGELAVGRWDAATETATAALAAPPSQMIGPRISALIVLALVRARRGDTGYWGLLDDAQALADDSGELEEIADVSIARAEAAWLEGRAEAIAEETRPALALAERANHDGFRGLLFVWRRRGGVPVEAPAGAFELDRRLLSGDWEAAADGLRASGCEYEAALALADSGEPAALRRAHDALQQMGARPAAAIVARRLRELGERSIRQGPRARTRANPAGLTAREMEVMPLLAAGLRNSDIAARLIVSRKTVDHHVLSILRKLGATTRGQAVATARQLGLSEPDASSQAMMP
jgi:DNA-binding CsgD family transcriptional regulator/tetratricopeptide (TPR) repeat protein